MFARLKTLHPGYLDILDMFFNYFNVIKSNFDWAY